MFNREQLYDRILKVLEDSSQDNPVPVKTIEFHLDIKDSGSCPRVRKLIRELLDDRQVAIGSSNSGYFLLHTEKEMQRYLNGLLQRQIAMSQRIQSVYNAFYNKG